MRRKTPTPLPSGYAVYIVRCQDGSFYTGYTRDLAARIRLHNSGRGAKYTRSHRPVRLVYHETFESRAEAMRREAVIKTYTRDAKKKLVQNFRKTKRAVTAEGTARV